MNELSDELLEVHSTSLKDISMLLTVVYLHKEYSMILLIGAFIFISLFLK